QKQKKLIMLPSETMIWQPEFTDKTLSRKPGAVHTHPVLSASSNYRQRHGSFLAVTVLSDRNARQKTRRQNSGSKTVEKWYAI
ncbi:hypothetical protein, partial [Escherichia coli]